MLKTYKPLVILAIIGFIALPSGKALKCYQCTPTETDDCGVLKDDMSKECSAPTNPTQAPPPAGSTEPQPTTDTTESQPTTDTTESQPTTDTTESQPTTDTTESQPTTDTTESEPTTDTTESQPTTDTTESEPTTDTTESEPTTDTTESEPTTDTTESEPTTDTTESEPTTDTTESQPTTESTETPTEITETTDTPTTVPPAPPSEGGNGTLRKRRSLINRFSRLQLFDEAEKPFCYKVTVTVNDKTKTARGCAVGKMDEFCKGINGCTTCDSDNCNSATSNIVYTSMIMSLVIVLLFTK